MHREDFLHFDYLRTFAVLLVLLHHAILAYTTFAFLNPLNPIATFSPIVDGVKWINFDRIVGFNDTFFMPLLFFISGLFVWHSLKRRGVRKFLLNRCIRLGIPFVIGVLLPIPLAFYPTVLEIGLVYGGSQSFGSFWLNLAQNGFGTAGPLWFVWLLLIFDCLAAFFYLVVHRVGRSKRGAISVLDSSLHFAWALIGLSFAAYLPVAGAFGAEQWLGIGPFQMQISRVFLYLLYFAAGVAIGARGLERGAFRTDGPFAKRWWAWLPAGVIAYVGLTLACDSAKSGDVLIGYAFTIACALLVLGITSVFLRFVKQRVQIIDNLSRNAYGIYIIHYAAVTWIQYALLETGLPAILKGSIVFLVALAFSWGSVAVIRRIRAVARVI